MRRSLTAGALLLAVSLLAASALAQEAGQVNPVTAVEKSTQAGATQAGRDAGRTAGIEAGTVAGASAGAAAAAAAVSGKDAAPSTNTDEIKEVTEAEWAQFQKEDPGAVAFFKEFDRDSNQRWSEAEWDNGIREAINRKLLSATFDRVGTWALMQKDANGEINLRDFLGFASRTKASSPQIIFPEPTAADAVKDRKRAKHCKEVFDMFDKDGDEGLNADEFRMSVTGHIADDAVLDTYYSQQRNGPGRTLNFVEFARICTSLTGLPADAQNVNPVPINADPCDPNPCRAPGTRCVPDPKRCVTSPCPQYKCAAEASSSSSGMNSYGKCVSQFDQIDQDRSRKLTEEEFTDGVLALQKQGSMRKTFRPADVWAQFVKSDEQVDVYQYVHFCIAVSEGDTDTSPAREDCMDVFFNFDENKDAVLSEREFMKGMRRARRQGHLPSDLNVAATWAALPKDPKGNFQLGPFVDFCLALSRGESVQQSVDAIPVEKPLLPSEENTADGGTDESEGENGVLPTNSKGSGEYGGGNGEYGGGNGEYGGGNGEYGGGNGEYGGNSEYGGESEPTTDSKTAEKMRVFCENAYKQADNDFDGSVSLSEFHGVCYTVTTQKMCGDYSAVYMRFDVDQSNDLDKEEFIKLCNQQGFGSPDSMTKEEREAATAAHMRKLQIAEQAGQDAGRVAGAEAGGEAGAVAGKKAGSDLVGGNVYEARKPATR